MYHTPNISVSHKTDPRTPKQKALEILDNDKVKRVMNGLWEVQSISEKDVYEIELVNTDQSVSGYTCGCKAWKFSDDKLCKHVIAVRIFENGYIKKGIVDNIVFMSLSKAFTNEEIYDLINR